MPELTLPLQLLSSPSITKELLESHLHTIEAFVCKLYGMDNDVSTVNGARLQLFSFSGNIFDQLPPSSDALFQHLLRVTYAGLACIQNYFKPVLIYHFRVATFGAICSTDAQSFHLL